jgi:hypothetical protein
MPDWVLQALTEQLPAIILELTVAVQLCTYLAGNTGTKFHCLCLT